MKQMIEITMEDNTKIYVESLAGSVMKSYDSLMKPVASSDAVVRKAKDYFQGSLGQIKSFASSVANAVRELDVSPDEFEIEFAAKFSADAGIIISSVGTEANLTIKMKWAKEKD